MAETAQPEVNEDYINKMYDSQMASQKEQLTQSNNQAISDLDATKQENQQQLAKNLNVTAVESQRAQKNYNEVQNAYGLTSGAMSQARLAQDNQLQADLTALRTAHQTADAAIEQQRALLSQQYSSAIAQAQAENDLARAQALYQQAKEDDAQLLAKQEAAAQLMAGAGDYSLIGQLYDLTDEQIAALTPKVTTTSGSTSKTWNINAARRAEIAQLVDEWHGTSMYDGFAPVGTTQKKIADSSVLYSDEEREYANYVLTSMVGGY